MKRIMAFILPVLIFTGSFLYLAQFAEAFGEPDPPYPGRVYTHQQWMRVFVKVGNEAERLIDANWRSVFNYPGTLEAGYTADHAVNVSQELANWLRAANLYHASSQNYLLSAQGAKEMGLGSPPSPVHVLEQKHSYQVNQQRCRINFSFRQVISKGSRSNQA